MGWLGNLCAIILAAVVFQAATNLRSLTDPLYDHDFDGKTSNSHDGHVIRPSWLPGQRFHLLAFVSRSSRFSRFSLHDLMQLQEVVVFKENLVFENQTHVDDIVVHLNLIDDTAGVGASVKENNVSAEEDCGRGHGNGSSEASPLEVVLPQPVWKQLRANSTSVFLHVALLKASSTPANGGDGGNEEASRHQYRNVTAEMVKNGSALYGVVRLLKHDTIQKRYLARHLLEDYRPQIEAALDSWSGPLLSSLGVGAASGDSSNNRLSSYIVRSMTQQQSLLSALPSDAVLTYWKPEVAVQMVADWTEWPHSRAPSAIAKSAHNGYGNGNGKKGAYYAPPLHVDEIGLTSEKYIPLNDSVHSLPLKLSYGSGMGLSRWLLMQELRESLQIQKDTFGFTDKDIDDVRRLVSETSLWFLSLTALASMLHLLFEVLAFQSDILFWKENTSLVGLSARAVVAELLSQIVIFVYLLDSDTSLLVTMPAAAGVLIQVWKVKRATGLRVGWRGVTFSRLQDATRGGSGNDTLSAEEAQQQMLHAEASLEADKYATEHLMLLVLPLVLANALRSLIMELHGSWYSWVINSLTASVYAFGFVLMIPQLYINHKLKSVSRMPWTFLTYRFINTFIDDLFAFVIKMPTMHRLSVFRDDLIFIVYLYQRYIYSIDDSRPIEK
jgi:hypothetical protein